MNGMGLGSTLCKRIIDSLHGSIHCTSIIGKGTEIMFVIPVPNCEPSNEILTSNFITLDEENEFLSKAIYKADF